MHVIQFSLYTSILFNREFVVDLVGEPGNVHGPDSSINGGVLSSVPSPFQISHLKEFQQPCVDDVSFCQILKSKNANDTAGNPLYPGMFSTANLEVCYQFSMHQELRA